MHRWTTREELVLRVVTLHREGVSNRAICRTLQISRNTIRKIITAHAFHRERPHKALLKVTGVHRKKAIDAFEKKIFELLGEYPDMTSQRIFEELRASGFSGGYTVVKDHVRSVRPPKKPEPSLPTPVYGPGEMAESDWATRIIDFTSGRRQKLSFFSYVLVHSTRKSYDVFERADLHALMDGHVRTFARLGGLARACKYDCQKAVVLRFEGPQPIYNPRFLAFATHYEFRPVACRPRHPNDKPRTERSIFELDQSFFNGRKFKDLDDLRAQLTTWMDTICDPRPNKKKLRKTRLELFEEERPHLLRLPVHPYDTARVAYSLCTLDGFVAWAGNRYAVPYDHITDILPLRITQNELFVYAPDLTLVVQHQLAPKSSGFDVGTTLHQNFRSRQSAMSLERVEKAFTDLGGDASDFFRDLVSSMPKLAGYHGRQILLLRERYDTEDLVLALQHARSFAAFEHKAIERILVKRAQPRKLAEYIEEKTERRLHDEIGAEWIGPRDLTEYDQLPSTSLVEKGQEK